MPYRNGNIVWNATVWTDEMIQFLKDNYKSMTNRQLAKALNLSLTVTRNKTRELGLKKIVLEYWDKEQIEFLKANYRAMGDVQIMQVFKKHRPKHKGWKRGAIWKKRKQLKLIRTKEEKGVIVSRNSAKGGPSYTIDRNSSSKNMHPRWVAQQLAWREPELQDEILKHPELIAAGTELIKLKREIKNKIKENAR